MGDVTLILAGHFRKRSLILISLYRVQVTSTLGQVQRYQHTVTQALFEGDKHLLPTLSVSNILPYNFLVQF